MNNIPQSELEEMVRSIRAHPEYLDPKYVLNTYQARGIEVIPDPFSADIITPIKYALHAGKALSVIRIGDGEINLISYKAYTSTPNLDHHVVKRIIAMQQDRFEVDPIWMIILRDLMMGALLQADIIGVIGLWRPNSLSTEELAQLFLKNHRGVSGQWRAVDFMLKLASQSILDHKLLTSAHLYFSLLEYLDDILPLARMIFIISDRKTMKERFKQRYPNLNFEQITVGKYTETQPTTPSKPDFLSLVDSALPMDLRGCLCLVGAGPWAEIYCTWIKQRGGVGVDIGSGFDLLDGQSTRPVHEAVGRDKLLKYIL